MKNNQTTKTCLSKLYYGKVKDVSFMEKARLMVAGFWDGRHGLPREDSEACWISPHLDQERHSYLTRRRCRYR